MRFRNHCHHPLLYASSTMSRKYRALRKRQLSCLFSRIFSSYYFKKLRRNLIFNYQSFHTIGYLNKLLMISIWTQKAQ
uniref:Ovule protein n=1 Tax=Heterorhabditis bacteriophora TaxID=37862 RepID=A0A1I7WHI5_HETBA